MNRVAITIIIASIMITTNLFAGNTQSSNNGNTGYPKGYYNRGPLPEKTVYLTFDDGPAEWTDGILDVLKKGNVKATFFVSAYWNDRGRKGNRKFRKYSKTLIRMKQEGHIIANHTADHRILNRLTPEEIRDQFRRNQELLNDAMGKDAPVMTILRPPLGYPWYKNTPHSTRISVGKTVAEIGIVALWTKEFDSSDSWKWVEGEWYRNSRRIDETNPEFISKMHRIYERTVTRANGRGMVVLMHETHNTTLRILPAVIQGLKAKGYRFATIEEFVTWRYGKSSRKLIGR
jgi:peptidoglycan/xylan/chitin deacetylase (PgdA/CDA1 family)